MKLKAQTIDLSQGINQQSIDNIKQSLTNLGFELNKVTDIVRPLEDAMKEQEAQKSEELETPNGVTPSAPSSEAPTTQNTTYQVMKPIGKLAKLEKKDLERIYELTYKYGWLTAAEREYGGTLPDQAYLEKSRIESELVPLLDKNLQEMKNVYSDYLVADGAYEYLDEIEKLFKKSLSDDMLSSIENLGGYAFQDIMSSFFANNFNQIDKDKLIKKQIKYFNDYLYLFFDKNLLDSFFDDLYVNSSIEKQEYLEELLDKYNYYDEKGNPPPNRDMRQSIYLELIKKENLLYDFFDWVYSYYPDISFELAETYLFDILYPNQKKELKQLMYDEVKRDTPYYYLIDISNELKEASALPISEKIILFQKALTAVHNTGPMTTYLLDIRNPTRLLNQLSSDKNVKKWNKELERVIPGFIQQSSILKKLSFICNYLKMFAVWKDYPDDEVEAILGEEESPKDKKKKKRKAK